VVDGQVEVGFHVDGGLEIGAEGVFVGWEPAGDVVGAFGLVEAAGHHDQVGSVVGDVSVACFGWPVPSSEDPGFFAGDGFVDLYLLGGSVVAVLGEGVAGVVGAGVVADTVGVAGLVLVQDRGTVVVA